MESVGGHASCHGVSNMSLSFKSKLKVQLLCRMQELEVGFYRVLLNMKVVSWKVVTMYAWYCGREGTCTQEVRWDMKSSKWLNEYDSGGAVVSVLVSRVTVSNVVFCLSLLMVT